MDHREQVRRDAAKAERLSRGREWHNDDTQTEGGENGRRRHNRRLSLLTVLVIIAALLVQPVGTKIASMQDTKTYLMDLYTQPCFNQQASADVAQHQMSNPSQVVVSCRDAENQTAILLRSGLNRARFDDCVAHDINWEDHIAHGRSYFDKIQNCIAISQPPFPIVQVEITHWNAWYACYESTVRYYQSLSRTLTPHYIQLDAQCVIQTGVPRSDIQHVLTYCVLTTNNLVTCQDHGMQLDTEGAGYLDKEIAQLQQS